jgi:glycosyltransferase involved in cell wall biosynthesis
MNPAPLAVSIIVPTYNRADLLPRALDSVLAQVGPEDEILVADDASTDQTAQVMRRYSDRVQYHVFEHGGAGVTRNRALRLATRPLVAFLDSDDSWMPGKLYLQRRLMQERPDVAFCFSNFAAESRDGTVTHHALNQWNNDKRGWSYILGSGVPFSSIAPLPEGIADFPVHIGDLYLAEMQGDHILTSSMMVNRKVAGTALRFAEDMPVLENKECFARLAGAGPAAYLDIETTLQNGHAGPRLSQGHKLGWSTARLAVYERVWMQDAAFMARHGERLHQLVRAERLNHARLNLSLGRTREAREDLRLVTNIPASYRLASLMPAPMLRGALRLRLALTGKSTFT